MNSTPINDDNVPKNRRNGFRNLSEFLTLTGGSNEKGNSSTPTEYFLQKYNDSQGKLKSIRAMRPKIEHWRMKEKLKTAAVGLIVCLNIGVDPPDILKTDPCATLECWVDPKSLPVAKALESIGKNLQQQYEFWQPRARYRASLDPTVEDVKKLCSGLRRNAKEERVLIHYNGHGVPRPTLNGEIWVFNKEYTQYIPLSIFDMQIWLGTPCVYVFDCSAAGFLVQAFLRHSEQKNIPVESQEIIYLAACESHQILPMSPDLPADLFTSCLTTPIEIAIRWFIIQNSLLNVVPLDVAIKIPGRLNDRRTPLGELNWIFTAITDSIAWNTFPRELFRKLFRQDLMVAGLFRNFILAERIMKNFNCDPVSHPKLPNTHKDNLWLTWDLALDRCLSQIPGILNQNKQYVFSSFFSDQLTGFEIWLEKGRFEQKSPEKLPIVLQVLLSQSHRLRALELIGKFLDLGAWAIAEALSVGIFPYILKLLQSPAVELRQVLVFIWAKIIAVEPSCQADLLKENGYQYFIQIYKSNSEEVPLEQKASCAFILAAFCDNFLPGVMACHKSEILVPINEALGHKNMHLVQWSCLLLSKLVIVSAIRNECVENLNIHFQLVNILKGNYPIMRAIAAHALSQFLGNYEIDEAQFTLFGSSSVIDLTSPQEVMSPSLKTTQMLSEETETAIMIALLDCLTTEASPMVKKEVAIALSYYVYLYYSKFLLCAYELWEDERTKKQYRRSTSETTFSNVGGKHSTIFSYVWKTLLNLSVDSFPDVSKTASFIVDQIHLNFVKKDNQNKQEVRRVTSMISIHQQKSESTASLAKNFSQVSIARAGSLDDSNHDEVVQIGESILLPLESSIYDYCKEQYSECQTQLAEECDPGSYIFKNTKWKAERNEVVLSKTKQITDVNRKFSESIGILNQDSNAIDRLVFHKYDETLIACDTNCNISCWNWSRAYREHCFSARRHQFQRISSVFFINENLNSLLAVGSNDGVLQIWKNYDTPNEQQLISSWKTHTSLMYSPRIMQPVFSGTCHELIQSEGRILSAGESRKIMLWDIEREQLYDEILSNGASNVTSLSADKNNPAIFYASFGDGFVRMYDVRIRENNCKSFKEHNNFVLRVSSPYYLANHVISGSISGEIKFWDVRNSASVRTINMEIPEISSISFHDSFPLISTGSNSQVVNVLTNESQFLGTIKYHEGFLGQRISPVTNVQFHPYKMVLASGGLDGVILLLGVEK